MNGDLLRFTNHDRRKRLTSPNRSRHVIFLQDHHIRYVSCTAILFRHTLGVWTQELSMTTPPCLAGLPVPSHAAVDKLLVHAFFAARMPPDGHPWSDRMNNLSATTPSPSKISASQRRQKYAPGPLCGAQSSARPSRDATTTTTIARGPPQHDNSGNNKALEENQSFVRVYPFSMSETRHKRVVRRKVQLCLIIAYPSRHTLPIATEHP